MQTARPDGGEAESAPVPDPPAGDQTVILSRNAGHAAAIARADALEVQMAAINEELCIANQLLAQTNTALEEKVTALAEVNAELQSYIAASQIPKIFLNTDLTLKSYSELPEEVFAPGGGVDASEFRALSADVLRSREQQEIEWRHPVTDRTYLVRAVPFADAEGVPAGVALTFADVTDLRRNAELLASEQIRRAEALVEIEGLYRHSPMPMALFDADKRYLRINQKLADINGVAVEAHIGRTATDVVPGVAASVEACLDRVLETGEDISNFEICGGPTGREETEHVFEVDFHPVRLRDELIGVGVIVQDVTEERAREAEMKRVMRELQHRVKNILANVLAVVNQARRSHDDPETAIDTLAERVQALASTHNLLSAKNWRSTGLMALAEQELCDVYGRENATITGPEVAVSARTALAVAMAFHEMATNAAKYGALSTDGGHVTLGWDFEGDDLVIRWGETGGPPAHEPERIGFGTMLVISTIEKSLGGSVQQFFEPSGFSCVLSVPREALRAGDDDDDTDGTHAESHPRSADPLA